MSKKNFKVATTENGKTTKQDTKHTFATANIKKDKTPTGKVKTIKDREQIRKEREEQYQIFRINALKRRTKRIGLSEEDTNKAVEELKNQLNSPNQYDILLFFNPNNAKMIQEALTNKGIAWKIMSHNPKHESDGYAFIVGDQEVLATIREIVPPGTKVHPYVKKKPPILPIQQPPSCGAKPKTKAQKKNAAATAKMARKIKNVRKRDKKKMTLKTLRAAKKRNPSIVVHMSTKKRSEGSKKASTGLKKAA